jgi:signal transduction histidine kinase
MAKQPISIRNKITVLILIVSILILGTGFAFVLISYKKSYKEEMLHNTLMNTQLVGEYCIGPLSFNRNKIAEKVLAKLDTIPYILEGNLYDENNVLFASYSRNKTSNIPNILQNEVPSHKFTKEYLEVTQPVIYDNNRYGSVVLKASTKIIQSKIEKQLFILILGMVGLMAFVLTLSYWLQQIISKPILRLEKFTQEVAEEGDYSLRIQKNSNDEIGNLYDAFNNLMDQILHRQEARDKAEQALKIAKDKAEESDRLKSAFLANVSHEIRTPLNAILGFSELLTMPESQLTIKEKESYIRLIFTSGNNLLKLIDDIIDISKIESNQLRIKISACDIKKTTQELLVHFNEMKKIKEKDQIEIKLDESSNTQRIIIDTDQYRFKQIFFNLIDNALKFTEEGIIKFGYIANNQEYIYFYVEDSGIGLQDEQMKWIFERFRKVESTDKLYRGAGLGLTISKYLVERLGGKIGVKSNAHKGCTFYFTLPYTKAHERAMLREQEPPLGYYEWPNKTILIVEDEPANIHFLEEIIKTTNAKILVARNGQEAVEIFDTEPGIDAIVMDIKMPKMDGYQATEEIRKRNQQIPIISQTAYAFDEEMEKAKKVGMTDYIAKPIKPIRLLSIIAKHLDGG